MSAALAITSTFTRVGATLALTGATGSTKYAFVVTYPGGSTATIYATTSGGGAATVTVVPGAPGTLSCKVLTVPTPTTEVATVSSTVTAF